MIGLSHRRRQQLRRLRRAVARGAQAAAALAVAAALARADAVLPALAAATLGAALLADGAHALRLAGRSRVGAASEARVRQALSPLRAEGWTVRHGVWCPGGGDIDHVARSPGGLGFAIETKTLRYEPAHLERTAATARWLARRGRRYPLGVLPTLCVASANTGPGVVDGVLLVSLDHLIAVLRAEAAFATARTGARPRHQA